MYVVSCRKDFESNILFGDANLYRNYTDPSNPAKFTGIDSAKVLDAAKNKHVLVLVHGFNNPIENVAKSYWELLQGLDAQGILGKDAPYGLVVGFTWPGSRTPLGYFGAVPKANRSAGPPSN